LTHRQCHDHAILGTLVAQQAGELARVDVGDGDGALLLQVLRQRLGLAEVGGQNRQVFDDQTSGMDTSK
jgi:hypothetical protein